MTKEALAEAVADKFGLRREDLPDELQTEEYAQTACQYCGMSFLVATEMREMQDRLVSAEATVEGWRDRIEQTTRAESDRDAAVKASEGLRAKVQAMACQRRKCRQAAGAAARALREARKGHGRLHTAVLEVFGPRIKAEGGADAPQLTKTSSQWFGEFSAEWLHRARGIAETIRARQLESSIEASRKHSRAVAAAEAVAEEAAEAAKEEVDVLRAKLRRAKGLQEDAERRVAAAEAAEKAAHGRLAEMELGRRVEDESKARQLEAILSETRAVASKAQEECMALQRERGTWQSETDASREQVAALKAEVARVKAAQQVAQTAAAAAAQKAGETITSLHQRCERAEAEVAAAAARAAQAQATAAKTAAEARREAAEASMAAERAVEEAGAGAVKARAAAEAALKAQHEAAVASLRTERTAAVKRLLADHEAALDKQASEHAIAVKAMQLECADRIERAAAELAQAAERRSGPLVAQVEELERRAVAAEAARRSVEAEVAGREEMRLSQAEAAAAALRRAEGRCRELEARTEDLQGRLKAAQAAAAAIEEGGAGWEEAAGAVGELLAVLGAGGAAGAAAVGAEATREGVVDACDRAGRLASELRGEVDSMRLTIERECAERMFLMEELNEFREGAGMERLTMEQVRRGGDMAHAVGGAGGSDRSGSARPSGVGGGGLARHGGRKLAGAGAMAVAGAGAAQVGSWMSARGRAGARRGMRR